MSAGMTWPAPRLVSASICEGGWTKARVGAPARASAATTARPVLPEAPVTRIMSMHSGAEPSSPAPGPIGHPTAASWAVQQSCRDLPDQLFKDDGQPLSALVRRLTMTRFGVMKHLRVLEEAGLVITRRRGREKLHFLNPVPIRLLHDRGGGKDAEPRVATLSDLKHRLEDKTMEKVFEIYIKTTPERLWEAITDPELRRKDNFGGGVYPDWKPGLPYQARE